MCPCYRFAGRAASQPSTVRGIAGAFPLSAWIACSNWVLLCCDETPLLQALLDEWRAELNRKPLGMTEADACQALEIEAKEGEQVSRVGALHCVTQAGTLVFPGLHSALLMHAVQLTEANAFRAGLRGGAEGCL